MYILYIDFALARNDLYFSKNMDLYEKLQQAYDHFLKVTALYNILNDLYDKNVIKLWSHASLTRVLY